MKVRFAVAILLGGSMLLASANAVAARHSGQWCGDAVLFSVNTALYHDLGRDRATMDHNIDTQWNTFQQEFPRLSKQDMHRLLAEVFDKHWTRFEAGKNVAAGCDYGSTPPQYHADYLDAGHSDDWCADAMIYSMFTAIHSNFGYSMTMLDASVENGMSTYTKLYPALSMRDLLALNRGVFSQKWKRYDAAKAMGVACKVSGLRKTSAQP